MKYGEGAFDPSVYSTVCDTMQSSVSSNNSELLSVHVRVLTSAMLVISSILSLTLATIGSILQLIGPSERRFPFVFNCFGIGWTVYSSRDLHSALAQGEYFLQLG